MLGSINWTGNSTNNALPRQDQQRFIEKLAVKSPFEQNTHSLCITVKSSIFVYLHLYVEMTLDVITRYTTLKGV